MERMIVQHLHTEKSGRKPLPEDIMYGELAINYAANGETLFIKNSESAITEFKDDKYYQKQLSEKTDKTLSLTYSELVSLRDNSQLIPGQQYRITDYVTTTTQDNTQSAGHQFDIIVTADDESTLNEEARAALHSGDEYFSGCNLNAWKIWYCLDNDTNRFAWAKTDETLIGTIAPIPAGGSGTYTYSSPISKIVFQGKAYNLEIGVRTQIYDGPYVYATKTDDYTLVVEDTHNMVGNPFRISVYADSKEGQGVIYRMIDEFGNDCPYDFKNIQFYRQWDSGKSLWSIIPSDNRGIPCYTFSSSGNISTTSFTDQSLASSNTVYSNVIGKYVNSSRQTLNNNCFFGNNCYFNSFGNNCFNNTFENEYYNSNCSSNTFGNGCYGNTFRIGYNSNCSSNTFGNNCGNNTFVDSCENNTFGNDCQNNTFGNGFQANTFGNGCAGNTFGNGCYSNTFGNDFGYYGNNTFGNYCARNTFGNYCARNTFGNYCEGNIFGNYFIENTFGNECEHNTFGNDCYNIKFASDSSASIKYNYYRNNHFGDGCECIVLKGAETASNSQQVQNYNFAQGLKGTPSSYLTIDGVRNRNFETKVEKDSNGNLKIFCLADLIYSGSDNSQPSYPYSTNFIGDI